MMVQVDCGREMLSPERKVPRHNAITTGANPNIILRTTAVNPTEYQDSRRGDSATPLRLKVCDREVQRQPAPIAGIDQRRRYTACRYNAEDVE